MQRTNVLERKIKTAKELQSIVKTMKGLAAVSISQYEHAVDSITDYYLTIERGLQIILREQPQLTSVFRPGPVTDETKPIAIIFGAGQPLCGAFNEVVAGFFHHWRAESKMESLKTVALGHRVVANLERYGWQTDHIFEMPTTVEHINETVQSLVLSIQQWRQQEEYSETYLFYNKPEANAGYKPVLQQLLPIDPGWLQELGQRPWQGRSIPTHTMNTSQLVSALVKQLLFVSIYKALASSLSAENNSRLSAMQVAEKKITDMIEDLTKEYRNQRQVNITEEILDIMASFEVQTGQGGF